jgi:hypothetical protein
MSTYYKFNFFTALRLRSEAKRNDLLVSSKTEQLQTSCISFLQKLIYRITNLVQTLVNDLKADIRHLDDYLEEGDKFGRKIPMHFPILTPSEISLHRKAVRMNWVWMIMMVLAEVGLYYIVSPFFIPQLGNVLLTMYLRLAASLVFAIAIMFAVSIGYSLILDYVTAKHLFLRNEIEEDRFKSFKGKQRIGIVLVVFGFGAIIVMAVMRHLMLTPSVNPNGITDELLRNSAEKKASSASWAAIFAAALALIFAILLAVSKNEAQKYAVLYKVFKQHLKRLNRLHQHMKQLNCLYARYKRSFAIAIKKGCDLVLHLKRLAKREVDVEFKAIAANYTEEKRRPGFAVNQDIYGQYSDIISKDKELFLYPVYSDSTEVGTGDAAIDALREEAEAMYKVSVEEHSAKGVQAGRRIVRSSLRAAAFSLLALVMFSVLFSSCTGKPGKNRVFVLFADASGSINYATKLSYRDGLRNIIKIAKPGDKIVILPIDAGTVNDSKELISFVLPDSSTFRDDTDPPQESDALAQERFNNYVNKQVALFDTCISQYLQRTIYANGTDIIGAFDVAMLYKVDTSKFIPVIIIMSDGLNCTPELNLEKGYAMHNPSDAILKAHDGINLNDWHIYFLTGNNPGITAERYLYAKSFWLSFMNAEKAKRTNIFYASGANSVVLANLRSL